MPYYKPSRYRVVRLNKDNSNREQGWYVEKLYEWIDSNEWLTIRGPFCHKGRAEMEMKQLVEPATEVSRTGD